MSNQILQLIARLTIAKDAPIFQQPELKQIKDLLSDSADALEELYNEVANIESDFTDFKFRILKIVNNK